MVIVNLAKRHPWEDSAPEGGRGTAQTPSCLLTQLAGTERGGSPLPLPYIHKAAVDRESEETFLFSSKRFGADSKGEAKRGQFISQKSYKEPMYLKMRKLFA